jgi:hypothetical protein
MADIVDFPGRMQGRQAEEERVGLTQKMLPIMAETIEKFIAMGASNEHIVILLQAAIQELKAEGQGK